METERTPRGPIDRACLIDWQAAFSRQGANLPTAGGSLPLEVEIGSGAGGFALGYASARQDLGLVALELRKKLVAQTAEKARKRGIPNLIVLSADAKTVLPRLFAPGSVRAFHIQFPDPWWKKRHHDRRLVDEDMAILLYNLLQPEGTIRLRTDVEQRGVEMAQVFEAVGFLNPFGSGCLAPRDPSGVPSSREKGYLERGEPIFRYVLQRQAAPPHYAPAPLPESTVGMQDRRL